MPTTSTITIVKVYVKIKKILHSRRCGCQKENYNYTEYSFSEKIIIKESENRYSN